MYKVKIINLLDNGNLTLPQKMSQGASGFDLIAAVDMDILPGKWSLVPTGIAIEMPTGLEAQVRPRSGLAFKNGVTVLNAPGTIDSDYRGEIKVILLNAGDEIHKIERGHRIAQLVFQQVPEVELEFASSLSNTDRGTGGFGHTGT